MKIPTTLKHKPVVVVENYEEVDGRMAYHSDAKGLSPVSYTHLTLPTIA